MLRCTSDVLCVGNRLKVAGPYATAHAAQMVPFESVRGLPDKKVMSQRRALAASTDTELPIAAPIRAAQPQCAAVSATRIDLAPETLCGWGEKSNERVAVRLPSLVVPMAPTSRDDCLATSVHGTSRSGWVCVKRAIKGSLGLHREPILSGVTEPGADTSRLPSILPQMANA